MSKNKRERNVAAILSIGLTEAEPIAETSKSEKLSVLGYLRNHLWIVGVIAVLSLGILGAGLKYFEEDARTQKLLAAKYQSFLSKVNPFMPAVMPSPTPQLSREYLYAGSRLLAVEDANANAAPPADLAVWRPSTGMWYVLGGPGSQQTYQTWGVGTDIAVPGDYDGDGKTDFSIFRPSTGEWWVVNSSDNSISVQNWGLSGDIPAPADYDGDGKTDRALYRPSNATWYIVHSSNQAIVQQQFGLSTDKPSPADYDGDGKADIGVWRDSNTTFYSINSTNGILQTVPFSNSSTQPVPADYDGDGKADYAIKNGTSWIIRKSSTSSFDTIIWQQSGDIPVQNDYDGDGKVDIATWRDSNGTWFIRQSSLIGQSGELRQVQWGMSGDIPVSAFYRR